LAKQIDRLSEAAQQKLLSHHWPGNVRELRNVLERAVILEAGNEVLARNLPDFHLETRLRKGDNPVVPGNHSIDELMASHERDLIVQTLELNRHNFTKTAEQLKISRHALRYRMQRLNIHSDQDSEEDLPQPPGKEVSQC